MSAKLPTLKVPKFSDLINYYETCNRAEGKSPKTIEWYSENLHRFSSFTKNKHISDSLDNIDIRLLREYVLHLMHRTRYDSHPNNPAQAEPLSSATIHGHVRTLRAFFNWLVREGLADKNVAADLKPPKMVKKVVSTLSDEEIIKILNTVSGSDYCQKRNRTIFMLLLDTGLRIGELVNLKMEDAHLDQGFLKVMGKGKKERVVPIGSNAQKEMQRYVFRYRPKTDDTTCENFFLSRSGMPITDNSIKLTFAKLAKESGVYRLHAHLCRHTFATRLLLNGGDVFTLQQILGHSTLEMVKHYVNLVSSHIVIQHRRFSPLDHINLRISP